MLQIVCVALFVFIFHFKTCDLHFVGYGANSTQRVKFAGQLHGCKSQWFVCVYEYDASCDKCSLHVHSLVL